MRALPPNEYSRPGDELKEVKNIFVHYTANPGTSAVQTRNFDSVSIECCYKAKDGSFTQETYDSLISLLAWLTDVYDLETEDILRHYDCGGKKCPLYYTNHPDKWEQLKKDVDKL